MKQIGNWVFGSFFRTIGRLLVFVVLGFIIARVVDFGDFFDNFRITDLFFEKVNAMALDGTIVKEVPINTNTRVEQNLFSNDYVLRHYFNGSTINADDGDVAVFVLSGYTSYYQQTDYDSQTQQYESLTIDNLIYSIKLINSSGYTWTSCELQNNRIVCPMIKGHGVYGGLEFTFHSDGEDIYFTFAINRFAIIYKKDNSVINDSINSQTQQQHEDAQAQMEQSEQQHNELMDTNSTQTDETSSSFFGNFTTEDQGGLSSIVTAPLSMINELLNGQCTQPSATWKGATISLPCGDMFWNRNGANALKDLLNVFYGGFICYYAIRKLFLMIESFKDPTNDRIEVSDL